MLFRFISFLVFSWLFLLCACGTSSTGEDTGNTISGENTSYWPVIFGVSGENVANTVAIDSRDSIYVAGYTKGALDGLHLGGEDAFIVKYDTSGNQQWIRQFGSEFDDRVQELAIDSANNIYTVDNSYKLPGPMPEAYVTKFNAAGDRLWRLALGMGETSSIIIDSSDSLLICGAGANSESSTVIKLDMEGLTIWSSEITQNSCNDLAVDSLNNVFVAGVVPENAYFFDLTLTKINVDGVEQWTKLWGTTVGNDLTHAIAVDRSDNLYMVGETTKSLDGQTFTNGFDNFVTKLNTDGDRIWTKEWGNQYDFLYDVALDSEGNIFMTGQWNSPTEVSTNTAKMDAAGEILWSSQDRHNSIVTGNGIAIDSQNNAYIVGYTDDYVTDSQAYIGSKVLIMKFSSDGSLN